MKRIAGFTLLVAFALFSVVALAQPGGRRPREGACFYSDIEFRGEAICLAAGQDAASLGEMGDRIRSIEIIGNAQTQVFNDREFRGENIIFRVSIPDLRQVPLASNPGKNWHTRISSIRVFAMRGDHDDRDHDRGDMRGPEDHGWHREFSGEPATVQCGAGRERQFCEAGRPVFEVRLVRITGERRCEWGESFGLDHGRLWTARGCAGVFEIR